MFCESCHKKEATVHLTQVIEGNVKKLHLCEECANKSGFDIKGPMSITDVLLGLGAEGGPGLMDGHAKECTGCGLSLSSFRKRGRLGCPDCYGTFEAEIIPLLDSMHHSTRHIGKVLAGTISGERAGSEIQTLEQMLADAVATENFEEAAVLRDRISELRDRGADQE